MRAQRIFVLSVFGLLAITACAPGAPASSGCRGGRGTGSTYHYNGVQGYWSGGSGVLPLPYAPLRTVYVDQPAYAVPRRMYLAPRRDFSGTGTLPPAPPGPTVPTP